MLNSTLELKLFDVGWAFLDAVYNIDSITESCYRAVKESGNGFYTMATQLDPRTVIENVIFNFGDMYDSMRDVVLFLSDNSRGEFHLPYDAGLGLGNAVYLVLEPS
jgi:hypothetical protein